MRISRILKLASLGLAIGLISAGSAFATRRGGVSGGGGGGIMELEPVGTAAVEQALREAPLALSLYFNVMALSNASSMPLRKRAAYFSAANARYLIF